MRDRIFARIIAAVILCTALGKNAVAQVSLATPLATDSSVVVGKLSNGLTYYIKNNPKPKHKVELRLVLKAGSIQENDSQQGLAHFMEHMEFNGLRHYPKNELVNYLQNIGVRFGADLNANTGWDRTYYLLPIPTDNPDNLRQGFQIVSDWAGGALITDDEVKDERKVIAEELRMRNKNAQTRMMRQFLPAMLNGSRYADRQPGGMDSIVQFASPQLIRDFYHDWYRPDLMAVIVVGDLPVKEAKKLVQQYFGLLKNPAQPRERIYYHIKPYATKKAMIVTDPENTGYGFSLIWPARVVKQDSTVAGFKKGLIKSIFMQCLSRKFRDVTQTANPPFSQGGLSLSGSVGGLSLLDKAMELDVTPVDDFQAAIDTAISKLLSIATYGFSEADIATSKKVYLPYYENAYKERNDRPSASFTDGLADAFMKGEPVIGIENEYRYVKELLPTVTLEDVNAYARKVLQAPDKYFVMATGPAKGKIELPDEAGLIKMVDAAFKQTPQKQQGTVMAKSLLTRLPVAGKIVKQQKDSDLGTTTYTLSNGVLVTVKPTEFQKDQVLFSGVKYGGSNIYGPEDRSNVTFLGSVIGAMGFGQFTPTALSDFLSDRQASMNASIGGITDEVNGSSSAKDVATMLQLAYLQMTAPRKDTILFKSWYNKVSARIALLKANPQNLFSDSLTKLLYGGNPLTPIVIPTQADMKMIDVDRILDIYKEQFRYADGFHFFFVGNVDVDSLKPLIEQYLGSLPVSGQKPSFKDNGLRKIRENTVFKYYKGQDQKSLVLDMYYGDVPYSADLALKANLLAQAMNIKVLDTIREKMQLIYSGSVSASVAEYPYGHYSITAQMPCGPQSVDSIFNELATEAITYKTVGVSQGDLKKIKIATIEQFKEGLQQNGTWLAEIKQVGFWGHDKRNFIDYEQRVNAVTPDELKATANLLLKNNHLKAASFPDSVSAAKEK